MRVSRPNTSLLILLLTLFSITITVRAQTDAPDEYDVKDRVVRVSFMAGEANLKRNGNQDWEPLRLNYPLVEGDTVATENEGRLEIQVDARNFVRLAPNTALRIVTLRDEGVALSVVQGTATVRLARFDRSREYFEIDAPRATLAAEKTGSYRIDVSREGRVRLTVRDGGSARIYSDTSGFTLRDGRSAELIIAGNNAGDWELLAAAPPDEIDDWVNERERYLAQRLRYDVQYYDEYLWGAEDLDAYGDWSYTSDFGWIWRPHASVISAYNDWAPYRYGHWTWCPPYGWTWVGYEPWGWAPYHYGRWVYHNNYWVWCPRSQYYRNYSWWRPALVAFVSFNFSFGDSICWYPLSYHQRDPHSRYYRHGDRRTAPEPSGQSGPRYVDHKNWRGVTRVPRTDFGNGHERGRPVDERTARRVVDSEPERGDWPRRGAVAGNDPGRDRERNQPADGRRRSPRVQIPDRPTGAAQRAPGIALDDELRRSRVFRGRDPRPEPTETSVNPGAASEPDTRPTGAVVRPEPSSRPNRGEPRRQPIETPTGRDGDRPGRRPAGGTPEAPTPQTGSPTVNPSEPQSEQPPVRLVRPNLPEGTEKRMRGQQGIEGPTPRTQPERRNEQPAPRSEPRSEPSRSESPPEPRSEPRPEARPEARPEPRSEPSRSESRPEPRSEPRPEARPEPRSEPSRSESRPEPRSEPRPEARPEPRSEPSRSESRPEPRSEPRPEARPEPRSEPSRSESRPEPRSEPRPEPRSEPSRSESRPEPRPEPRSEPSRSESRPEQRSEPRSEPPRSEPPRTESPRSDPEPSRPRKPDDPNH